MKDKDYENLVHILSTTIIIAIIIMLNKFLFKESFIFMNVVILWFLLIGKK